MARSSKPRDADPPCAGDVRDLAQGGEAVVATDRGVVFAHGGIPGERVRLAGIARQGGVLRGRIVGIERPSAVRVVPACAIAGDCGGCPWMHMSVEAQRENKARFVSESVGMPVEIRATDEGLGYRHRARMFFVSDTRLGYRRGRSAEIVDVSRCPVLTPSLNESLQGLRRTLLPALAGCGELHLGAGAGQRSVFALRSEEPQPTAVYAAVRLLVDASEVAGAVFRVGGAGADAPFGDPREVSIAVDGLALQAPIGGFSQAHQTLNVALVERAVVLADAAGQVVLELFAGHGNLTVGLARHARELLAVELDRAAAEACRANLDARGFTGVRVVAEDACAAAGRSKSDVVVLDPPRTGAADVVRILARKQPRRVVYVSCNPATLRRDLRILQDGGYQVRAAEAFDMFPQTAHVEAIVVLEVG